MGLLSGYGYLIGAIVASSVFLITPLLLRWQYINHSHRRILAIAHRLGVSDWIMKDESLREGDFRGLGGNKAPEVKEPDDADPPPLIFREYLRPYWAPLIFNAVIVLIFSVSLFAPFDPMALTTEAGDNRPLSLFIALGGDLAYAKSTMAVLLGTYLGAFVWAAQYLYRRLAGFDLSPTVYYRIGVRFIVASFIAVGLRHAMAFVSAPLSHEPGLLVGIGFVLGLVPQVGIDYIYEKVTGAAGMLGSHSLTRKRTYVKTPVDAVDGMMPFIKTRLQDFEIDDVQTLATENPLVLFARTPYDLAQIVDWIAQAQLILLVGEARAKLLRSHGIRNILIFAVMCEREAEQLTALLNTPKLPVVVDLRPDKEIKKAPDLGGDYSVLSPPMTVEEVKGLGASLAHDVNFKRIEVLVKRYTEKLEEHVAPTTDQRGGPAVMPARAVARDR